MQPDRLQRFFFSLQFKVTFLEKKGTSFQDFFSRIMSYAYPQDFQTVRAYGRLGDRKCDGFRVSDGTLFQVYAPDTMKLPELLAKIKEDFSGAAEYWDGPGQMRTWTLVHNDQRGLPPDAVNLMNQLREAHPAIGIDTMKDEALLSIAMTLSVHQLEDLFGQVPSQATMVQLTFEDVKPVLKAIQRQKADTNVDLKPVSQAKLERNRLSMDAAGMLEVGRVRESLVANFLSEYPDPHFAEELAAGFRHRYAALSDDGLDPDRIFADLQRFTGGMDGSPSHQAAVLAVLSYFFERCDIFEDIDSDPGS